VKIGGNLKCVAGGFANPVDVRCALTASQLATEFFGADFSAEDEVRIVSGQIAWFLDCTLVRRLRELTNLRGNRI
jgi:hypothetical protein